MWKRIGYIEAKTGPAILEEKNDSDDVDEN